MAGSSRLLVSTGKNAIALIDFYRAREVIFSIYKIPPNYFSVVFLLLVLNFAPHSTQLAQVSIVAVVVGFYLHFKEKNEHNSSFPGNNTVSACYCVMKLICFCSSGFSCVKAHTQR